MLNKATLCDSTNSKQNSSHSAFLRKSLWLLTSMKNKALKDVVNAQQANCQACHYLKKQGVGCFAQQNLHSPVGKNHAKTFIDHSQAIGQEPVPSKLLMKNNSAVVAGKKP